MIDEFWNNFDLDELKETREDILMDIGEHNNKIRKIQMDILSLETELVMVENAIKKKENEND